MKKIFLPFAAVALLLSSCKDAAPKEELVINLQEKGAEVASSMYGIFFEEINHAGDGGLYAELVKNRSFEELEMPEGYYAEGDVLHPKKVCNHISGEVREGSFRTGAGLDSEHKGCCGNETDQGTTQVLHGSEQSEGNH